jgi:carbon-monoxide dehydrogenase small subunit
MPRQAITLTVNGDTHEILVEARRLLLDALRDDLGLTGAKRGCEEGVCGCCTVLVDGKSVKSCLMLAVQAKGRAITTIEGLAAADGGLDPVQDAFVRHGALQCGYCTPGFIMMVKSLLGGEPPASETAIREALSGNICRCTGYVNIVRAIQSLLPGAAGLVEEHT